MADYVAILDGGVIVAEGNIEELKNLLPKGALVFSFACQADLQKAAALLAGYRVQANSENLSLSVLTDGSLQELSEILAALKDVDVSGFAQQTPSLEDVFLSIVDDGKHEYRKVV